MLILALGLIGVIAIAVSIFQHNAGGCLLLFGVSLIGVPIAMLTEVFFKSSVVSCVFAIFLLTIMFYFIDRYMSNKHPELNDGGTSAKQMIGVAGFLFIISYIIFA